VNQEDVGRYWDGNAEAWTKLARTGYESLASVDSPIPFFPGTTRTIPKSDHRLSCFKRRHPLLLANLSM